MKKYRLAYDCLFLPNDLTNGVAYKNERIADVAIYFVYKAINKKTNEENFFTAEDLKEQPLEYSKGKTCYVNHFYKCVFDRENGYKMILNEQLAQNSDYLISYYAGDCFKWTDKNDPILISYDEFVDILKTCKDSFDNSNNYPTQSTAYYTEEIQ